MKGKLPRISESEWVVMKELWRKHPQTSGQIVEALAGKTRWGAATIKTLINRLVTKKALGFDKLGREHHYSPLVSEADCAREEGRSFRQRVFDGSLSPMLASFLEREPLSPKEIAELKQILEEKERKSHDKHR